jgi:hypothetical protein
MYSGLYAGLLQRASVEYEKCNTFSFRCLRLETVGQYAAAVLAALYEAVTFKSLLTPEIIEENFALVDVPLDGDPVCCMCDPDNYVACESAIWGFLEEYELEVDEDLVTQLVASNCVEY